MRRIVARCPKCGAGLGWGEIVGDPFRCPQCRLWLRIPRSREGANLFVALALGALIAYRLGFRGFALLIGAGIGMWAFFVPASALLRRLWPLRPEPSWPDTGTLDLFSTSEQQPRGEPPAVKETGSKAEGERRTDVRCGGVPPAKEAQGDVGQGAGNTSEAPRPPPKSQA